jgi:hypothetical protein
MKLKRRPKFRMIRRVTAGVHHCVFRYSLGAEVAFEFTLLCECRDDVADAFKKRIDNLGKKPVVVEINESPWLVTTLVDKETP